MRISKRLTSVTVFAVGAALIVGLVGASPVPAHATPSIADPFLSYYQMHQGLRVMGYPVSDFTQVAGRPAQYFEKACIEDHRGDVDDPRWEFMYTRLTAILMEAHPQGSVSGTSATYADLMKWNQPQYRHTAPGGLPGGSISKPSSGAFVPYDPLLRPGPGYIVEQVFWAYISRTDLFPGGWLHDVGLPMTDAHTVKVIKNGEVRDVVLQAFERTVLTYDPRNPAEWKVERANIGADAFEVLPQLPPSLGPAETVQAFYNWYIHYRGNPLTSGAYKSSPYLGAEFVQKVEKLTGSFSGGGYDPIICAQDIPSSFTVSGTNPSGAGSAVLVSTNFPGHSFIVHLAQVKGRWVISDVTCGGGGQENQGPTLTVFPLEEGGRVTLPVHIVARLGQPSEQVTAEVTWQDGTRLTNRFTLLPGADGRGLLVANVDWVNMLQPPEPRTQPATLQIKGAAGKVLTKQEVVVLSPTDPNTREIKLYWTVSGAPDIVQPQTRRVINTTHIATRALEELLWGPPAISQVGFRTAIPTPEDIARYPGRQPDWGPRVTLRSVVIENGVATADFSKEMQAYGGGSLRVKMIREQITQTLKQFPSVREVRIAVEGRTEGVLEP